jgi:hypothetical protein
MFINQIEEAFLVPSGLSGDSITKFFIVLHSDNTADVYTNYNVIVEGRVNRDVRAGEHIYVHDITDIEGYRMEISIEPDDAIICVMKVGWKYGLYFDMTRTTSEEEVWRQLGLLYGSLHVDRIVQNIQKQIQESEQPHIITEGKSDWQHIEAARRKLGIDLSLGYPTTDETLGDTALLQVCQRLAKFGPPNRNKVIAIFDRDNPQVRRILKEKGPLDSYQAWGNNVYSLVLPRPRHRDGYKNISVEMLYTDHDVATTTVDGKRLFFNNELKTEVIPGSPARLVPIPPVEDIELDKKVFDGQADQIIDDSGRHVGLSKARFAELVYLMTQILLYGCAQQARSSFRRSPGTFRPGAQCQQPSAFQEALPVHMGPPRSPDQAIRSAGRSRRPRSSPCFHSRC